MDEQRFDRASQDVGNIVFLEHVNLRVPDQLQATTFYVEGLGLTRDPYYMVGTNNMWVNVGRQQLHIQTGDRPQVFRGRIGLILPNLEALPGRLQRLESRLSQTAFSWSQENDQVRATCPWGNQYVIREACEDFGSNLGMPFVEMDVPQGAADDIAEFHRDVMQARVTLEEGENRGRRVRIGAGPGQNIFFRETTAPIPPFDGHHLCIYLAWLYPPYEKLHSRGLISSEDNRYQFRFEKIVSLASGQVIFEIQHEVRSLYHPLFMRELVNRTGLESLP